jgi:hypothetical protein
MAITNSPLLVVRAENLPFAKLLEAIFHSAGNGDKGYLEACS